MAPYATDACLVQPHVHFPRPLDLPAATAKFQSSAPEFHATLENCQSQSELRGDGENFESKEDVLRGGLSQLLSAGQVKDSLVQQLVTQPVVENGKQVKGKKGKKLRWRDECGLELAAIREIESRETVYEFDIEIIDDDVDFCTCSLQ